MRARYAGLAPRERAVLQHLLTTEGQHPSNREIAAALERSRWEVSRALGVLIAADLIEVVITDGHLRTITVH